MDRDLQTLATLRQKLRLRMNGEVAQAMRRNGLKYRLTYGCTRTDIAEIGKEMKYEMTDDVRRTAWESGTREEMMIAAMSIGQADREEIIKMATECPTTEIMEILGKTAGEKESTITTEDTIRLLDKSNTKLNCFALIALTSRTDKGATDRDIAAKIMKRAMKQMRDGDMWLKRGTGMYAIKCITHYNIKESEISKELEDLKSAENKNANIIAEEIITEIRYGIHDK